MRRSSRGHQSSVNRHNYHTNEEMTAELSNWRAPPQNKWAFRNIDKLLSTHIVRNGGNSTSLTSSDSTVDTDLRSSLMRELDSYIASTDTDGLIVLHKGGIVFEHYATENDDSTKHIMMSMTKSVTGLITGILASRGKIDVNAPIKKYVPEASRMYDNVSIQQCLDMQSGVKYNDNSQAYRGASGWNPLSCDDPKTLHAFIEHFEAEMVPNAFNYCSVNTDLLGWALERAAGKTLAELITELLWRPMDAESDGLLTVDSEGSARAGGGLCATLRDIARIGQLLADGGREIVPKSWIDDMLYNGSKEVWNGSSLAPMFANDYESMSYRDCWYTDADTKTLCAMGSNGQYILADLKNNIVVAKTASEPDVLNRANVVKTIKAFKDIQRILLSRAA